MYSQHNNRVQALQQFKRLLQPGYGVVFVRDYAAGDLAQQRLASATRQKELADNFFVRGDGTRCLYFTEARRSLTPRARVSKPRCRC